MFNFLKKTKKAPSWNNLTAEQRTAVTKKMIKALQGGPRYKLVSGTDQWQRERGMIEHRDEDEILNVYGRGRMIDLARNASRNSSTFNGIMKQLTVNVCGTKAGKAIIGDFPGADKVRDEFRKWTREADFFDGLSLGALCKLILQEYVLNGDMVLLFDDYEIEGSGKIVVYESDEIGSTTEEAIKQRFGRYAKQSLGRVYSNNGRFIGAVVSRSQRGADVFQADQCYFLRRDPDASVFDSFWLMPRNVFRISQGRGIPPVASSLATILDLEDLCSFELAASKKNAQTLAQVIQSSNDSTEDATIPSTFDAGTDFEGMTDEEIQEAVKQERQSNVQTISLDRILAAGCVYQVMPENYKMELLDTKHPNSNTPEFINWLASRAAAPLGLSQQFATLKADGASFRSEQLMTWPVFLEAQKFLEGILDWVIVRWAKWAERRGIIGKVPEDFVNYVDWAWPKMDEIDQNAWQDAVDKGLRNMTMTYKDILGPDYKEKLLQAQAEIAWMKNVNLPHPAYSMISGGERTGVDEITEAE